MSATTPVVSEAAIWERVMEPERNGLSPETARSLLELTFPDEDMNRMNELAAKNRDGGLTDAERQELANYIRVGDVLSLLHLKARRSLNR